MQSDRPGDNSGKHGEGGGGRGGGAVVQASVSNAELLLVNCSKSH